MEALAAVANFFKALALGLGLIHDKKVDDAGATRQHAADLDETVKGDADARKIEGANAGRDRQQLLDRLHDQSAGGA